MHQDIKTCCFTGYRPHKLPFGGDESHPDCLRLKLVIYSEVERLILDGYTHFISGFGLGVDAFCAVIVIALKEKYPQITLESAIPCETQAARWKAWDRERYYTLRAKCDKETILSADYQPDSMKRRNHYMVEQSQAVLAVYDGRPGGTMQTVNYAKSLERKLIIINPYTFEIIR